MVSITNNTPLQNLCKPIKWQENLARLDGAYADSTLRAYRTDIRTFVSWCEASGLTPFPASVETMAAFIAYEAKRSSVSTIKRRLAALRKIHRLLSFDSPGQDEEVNIALRRTFRLKRTRQRQAMGLTRELREQLISSCPNTLSGIRDGAIISIGYDTLCRRSELVGLRIEDLTLSTRGSGQILIRRSKNDQNGSGRIGYVSQRSLKLLEIWLSAARIDHGYIFRSIHHDKISANPLAPYSINRILKQAASRSNFNSRQVEVISGHSLRVGAAQDLMTRGADILSIMRAGGWKTMNVVARYVENSAIEKFMDNFNE